MRPLLYAVGVYTVVWGIWIGNPFWTVFTEARVYDQMKSFLPEWAWGLNAIICGCVIIAGAYVPVRRCLLTGCAIGIYHWGTIALLYFCGDWRNTGGITSVTLAVLIYMMWREWDHEREKELRLAAISRRRTALYLSSAKSRSRGHAHHDQGTR